MAKEKSLEKIPAVNTGIMSLISVGGNVSEIPKTLKLTLPPMVKPKDVPFGATISGKLVKFVDNYSGKESLRGTKLFHLQNGEVEFLFPVSRSMKSAVSLIQDADDKDTGCKKSYVGKTIYLTRIADGGNKNHPENPMLNFDIRVSA